MNEGTTTNYEAYKTNLGIDSSFMIRFDNPFSNLDNAAYNKVAVINTQLAVLGKVLETIHTDNDSAAFNVSNKILSSSTEISFGDTNFIKDFLTNYDTD